MPIEIRKFALGPLETNAYLVKDGKSALIIDPSSGCSELISSLQQQALIPKAILLTHGHFDHLLGIPEIIKHYPDLPVYIHSKDKIMIENAEMNGSVMLGLPFEYRGNVVAFEEGTLTIGEFTFKVIFVPGHTPGGCAFLFENDCLCGDILFAGSVGRTDLPGGDGPLLIKGIREKLMTLPDTTVCWSGHGGRTTIGREKRLNPFINGQYSIDTM